jgi:hypothetical protein
MGDFLPNYSTADEAGCGNSVNLHVPAVLERADVCERLY